MASAAAFKPLAPAAGFGGVRRSASGRSGGRAACGWRSLGALVAMAALAALAALGLAGGARAQASAPVAGWPFQVVVHADFRRASISRGELAALFMRQRSTLDDGQPVLVVDAQDAARREQFYQLVAGRNAAQMHAYWSRMVFSGSGRPPPQSDTTGALGLLRRDASAIAYLPPGQDLRGLRVLPVTDPR